MATLTTLQQRFVLHWGEMGARWGINRTVAQIHALLYLAPRPLNAEEICDTLDIARSNVSTGLRELQNWGIVRVVHVLGDRRDHFETIKEVWELFRRVIEERKRREIDPTVEFLEQCVREAEAGGPAEANTRQRLAAMRDFFATMCRWYDQLDELPTEQVIRFVRMGEKVRRLVGAD